MKRLLTAFAVTPLLLGTNLLQAQERDFPGIEQLMSEADYRAAGLDKLTPAERDALNQWLISYTVEDAENLRHTSAEVQQAEDSIRIEAQIKGHFTGWRGDTVFALDNGQIWRQRLDGRFAYNGDDRRVVIEKNFFGFYKLTHVATGSAIGVTRIKR